MFKKVILVLLLTLLYSSGTYNAHAQEQPPALPHVLYGTAHVDDVPLTQADTTDVVSVSINRLLLIFLHHWDSQGLIADISAELDAGVIDSLASAFANSEYCQSRGLTLSGAATVNPDTPGSVWQVVDSGKKYTTSVEAIPVWDPGIDNWVAGFKLEVFEHDGIITTYNMGDLPTDDYVARIPVSSVEAVAGPPGNTYIVREPGMAMEGDEALVYINGILITDPVLPYLITEVQIFVRIDIYAPSTYEVNIDLVVGWNLISIPVLPQDISREAVLESIDGKYDSVWAYNAVTRKWFRYVIGAPEFLNDLDEIVPGMGFWIDMNQAGTLTINGIMPTTVIPLEIGWNLVGYNSLETKALLDAMSSIDGKYVAIWIYNAGTSSWMKYIVNGPEFLNDLEFLEPAMGIWIDSEEDCDWDIGL